MPDGPAQPRRKRFARELTALVGAPILIWLIGWAPSYAYTAMIGVITSLALFEFLVLGEKKGYPVQKTLSILLLLFLLSAFLLESVSVEMGVFASVGHGISGVLREVHHDLFQLPAVDGDLPPARGEVQLEADDRADAVGQQRRGGLQDGADVEQLRFDGLPASEDRHLSGEPDGALRGQLDAAGLGEEL